MIKLVRNSGGFTLIEILVVASLMVLMTSVLIKNFSGNKLDMDRIANQLLVDIRTAQSNALAAKKYEDTFRCGYGVTRQSSSIYNIYAGKNSSIGSCSNPYSFIDATTTPIIKTVTVDSRVDILNFQDVFFLPPDPKLYRGNGNSPATNPLEITLRKSTVNNCNTAGDCKFICVYPSGRVEKYNDKNLCN